MKAVCQGIHMNSFEGPLCYTVKPKGIQDMSNKTLRGINDAILLLVNQNFPRKCRPCVKFLKPMRSFVLILLGCNSSRTV